MAGSRPPWRVFTDNACRHTDVPQAEKTYVDALARLCVALDCHSAMVRDGAGHAQGTPCRADADTQARPSLTDKSVLR